MLFLSSSGRDMLIASARDHTWSYSKVASTGLLSNCGWTPLHLGAVKGHLNTVKYLCSQVQDKDPKDNYGWTPLHAAAGNLEVVKYLCDQVQDKNPKSKNGETPLHGAAYLGRTEVVKIKISYPKEN